MSNVIYTCLKVLIDEKCDEIEDKIKFEIGKFIKNIIMNSGEQNLLILRDMEAKMSPIEKEQLAKYVA
jgi:hypothetical protein